MHSANPEEADRAHRLFGLLDEDGNETVDVKELAHALKHSEVARELAAGFAPLADLVAVATERRRQSKRKRRKSSKRRSTMRTAFDPAAVAAMASKAAANSGLGAIDEAGDAEAGFGVGQQ